MVGGRERMHEEASIIDENDDSPQAGGHPLAATVIGCVVAMLGLLQNAEPRTIDAAGSGSLAYFAGQVVGGAVMLTLVIWGIAYAITVRKASPRWKVASLLIIFVVGLLVSLIGRAGERGAYADRARGDMRDTAVILKQVTEAGDAVPKQVRSGEGPMSRMSAAVLNSVLAERHAFERDAERAGAAQVLSFEGLTRTSAVLDRCAGLDALAETARANGRRVSQHFAAARAIGDEAVRKGEVPAGAIDAFMDGATSAMPTYERQWQVNAEIMVEGAGICRTLARRQWSMSNGQVMFERDRDLQDVSARQARIRSYASEQESVNARSRAQLKGPIEELSKAGQR